MNFCLRITEVLFHVQKHPWQPQESGTRAAQPTPDPAAKTEPIQSTRTAKTMWRIYLAVMAGGAAGVGARMLISNWIANHFGQAFPWGTLIVNVTGCLIIGVFTGLTGPDGMLMTSPWVRQVVAIGVLGGFTTYSSFSLQTINLLAEGEVLYGMANIGLTLMLCLIGTWSGLALASLIQAK